MPPSLKYTDYCIINEIEAQCTTGISLRENGELQRQNMKKALEKMNEMGVAKWADHPLSGVRLWIGLPDRRICGGAQPEASQGIY